jgi:hypothetical protein
LDEVNRTLARLWPVVSTPVWLLTRRVAEIKALFRQPRCVFDPWNAGTYHLTIGFITKPALLTTQLIILRDTSADTSADTNRYPRDPLAPIPFPQQVPPAVRDQVDIFSSAYSNLIIFVSAHHDPKCMSYQWLTTVCDRTRNVD